jgi:hypothetical protein
MPPNEPNEAFGQQALKIRPHFHSEAPFSQCARPNRRFEFNKRSQPFIRVHNVTLSVIAMHINH